MQKRRLRVTVDDRERSCEVPALLARREDVDLEVSRLPVGDYLVEDAAVFERKTLKDFAVSIVDGRLFNQAARLSECPLRPAIIVEGRACDLSEVGVRREALQGALVSLTLIFRIPVFRALDAEETARLIVYAADQLQRVGSNFAVGDQRTPKGLKGKRIRLLRTLPGVGRERAQALLEAFGSVENCIAATEEELMSVPGLGRKTAQGIRAMVEEEGARYGVEDTDWDL